MLLCPWDFPGKNAGVGLPFPFPGILPDPGIEPVSPVLQVVSLPLNYLTEAIRPHEKYKMLFSFWVLNPVAQLYFVCLTDYDV